MKNLWAPWRMQYIKGLERQDEEGCIFCEKTKHSNDKKNLILFRGKKNFVILNLFPYTNGHLMVVPYIHTGDCSKLDNDTIEEMWNLVKDSKHALQQVFHPDGFNIGMNIGRVSGAGIENHIHMHVVPRWNGDTNFMPVIGGTKVISQSLEDAYDSLKPYFVSDSEAIS